LITSDRFRDQTRNREDCMEKLSKILQDASKTPKIRKKTKPSHSSIKRVKAAKSRNSEKKRLRRTFD
jgi:ribosome-associated protein